MNLPLDLNLSIERILQKIQDAVDYANRGGAPYTT